MGIQLETPVVILAFNRPQTTRVVFDAVAGVKPRKLLLVADGPRPDRPREKQLCEQVRLILQKVDWPCEVRTNFSDSNLGCQERVVSGLNWAFSQVEEAVILEDDCVPHPSFFYFCQEMLERCRGDNRIGMISGTNFIASRLATNYSYYFSRISMIWGWATWRSAWARYDRYLKDWEAVKIDGVLREIYSREAVVEYWSNIFQVMHAGTGPDTWDYQWIYTNLINGRLSIVPNVNMVSNIGYGKEATHTVDAGEKWSRMATFPMEFPLKHPPYMIPMQRFEDMNQEIFFVPRLGKRMWRKYRSLPSRLLNRVIPEASGG